MYKLINNQFGNHDNVKRLSNNAYIPFDLANNDYVDFKKEINDEAAELQDADGNTMSAVEAKEFVATLP